MPCNTVLCLGAQPLATAAVTGDGHCCCKTASCKSAREPDTSCRQQDWVPRPSHHPCIAVLICSFGCMYIVCRVWFVQTASAALPSHTLPLLQEPENTVPSLPRLCSYTRPPGHIAWLHLPHTLLSPIAMHRHSVSRCRRNDRLVRGNACQNASQQAWPKQSSTREIGLGGKHSHSVLVYVHNGCQLATAAYDSHTETLKGRGLWRQSWYSMHRPPTPIDRYQCSRHVFIQSLPPTWQMQASAGVMHSWCDARMQGRERASIMRE